MYFKFYFLKDIQASFLPAIIEMSQINFRAFYDVFFNLIIFLFELLLPWLAKSFRLWKLLQIFFTVPIVLTAILQWLVNEINVLTKLAKRNGIQY